MKLLLIFAFLLLSTTAYGQSAKPCDLTLKDSPTIRGLKLGMPVADFFTAFGVKNKVNDSIYYKMSGRQLKSERFAGIKKIEANTFSDKIILLIFEYKNNLSWVNAKEFARNISENSNIPYESWRFNGDRASIPSTACQRFDVEIDSKDRTIELTDTFGITQLIDSEQQKRIDKKKASKP